MKKLLVILMIIIITVGYAGICYAAPENVDIAVYGNDETEIIEIANDSIPAGPAGTLPKTGGIPAEAFYVTGAVLIVFALVISGRKTKTESK